MSLKFREVDRLKTTLMRAASHDLRTPTTTILGAAETLRHLSLDEAEARALLAAISRGASRLSGLLEICSTLRASRRAWSSRWPSRPTSAR